jgi:uncharacterized membrane protein YvbJ
MKKCDQCNTELLTEDSFCPQCGHDLRKKIISNPKEEQASTNGIGKRYYYSSGGMMFGPASLEELIKRRVNAKTMILIEGTNDWQLAEDIAEFKELL